MTDNETVIQLTEDLLLALNRGRIVNYQTFAELKSSSDFSEPRYNRITILPPQRGEFIKHKDLKRLQQILGSDQFNWWYSSLGRLD